MKKSFHFFKKFESVTQFIPNFAIAESLNTLNCTQNFDIVVFFKTSLFMKHLKFWFLKKRKFFRLFFYYTRMKYE